MYEFLQVEVTDSVATVTMNRPEKLNALSTKMHGELADVFGGFRTNPAVRAVVLLSAVEKAFCAGQDIKDFPTPAEIRSAIVAPERAPYYEQWLIESLDKPVIAGLNGYVLGGGFELALACDFRIAVEDVQMGFPEVDLGAFPGTGGTQRLVRMVGRAGALDLILTCRQISASEALSMGLVTKVVPKENLHAACMELANSLAKKSPTAVSLAKESIIRGMDYPLRDALMLDYYRRFMTAASSDREEKKQAFLDKQ